MVAQSGLPDAADDLEDDVETRRAVVEAETHMVRLDKALVVMAPEFSRSHLHGADLQLQLAAQGLKLKASPVLQV